MTQDTIDQLNKLLQSIRKSDCVVMGGDLNCQLQWNVPDCTRQWCMTERPNKNRHDGKVLILMREHDLCAIDTFFKSEKIDDKGDTGDTTQRTCRKETRNDQRNSTICVSQTDGSPWFWIEKSVWGQRFITLTKDLIMGSWVSSGVGGQKEQRKRGDIILWSWRTNRGLPLTRNYE